jgi:hypothetical protein
MTLPPWRGDDEAMYRWCRTMLDHQLDEAVWATKDDDKGLLQWLDTDEPAIWSAYRGAMEPLRRRLPHLAPFLHPEKHGRGLQPRFEDQWEQPALDIVRRVKRLWRDYYDDRQRRRRDDGISAVEVAGRYLGLDPEAVDKWLKKSFRADKPGYPPAKPGKNG